MKYLMKTGICGYQIYDEKDRMIEIIQKGFLVGNKLIVSNVEKEKLYTIIRRDGEILIEKSEGKPIRCIMKYQERETRDTLSGTRLPIAEKIEMDVCCGILALQQTRKRIFTILLNGEKIGEMKHMMCLRKELHLEKKIPELYIGVLFAAGILMLHDDDIEIV